MFVGIDYKLKSEGVSVSILLKAFRYAEGRNYRMGKSDWRQLSFTIISTTTRFPLFILTSLIVPAWNRVEFLGAACLPVVCLTGGNDVSSARHLGAIFVVSLSLSQVVYRPNLYIFQPSRQSISFSMSTDRDGTTTATCRSLPKVPPQAPRCYWIKNKKKSGLY